MLNCWIKRIGVVAIALAFSACANNSAAPNTKSQLVSDSSSASKSVYIDSAHKSVDSVKYQVAEKDILRRVSQNPDDTTALLELAVLFRHMERFDNAEEILQQALQRSNNAPQVLNELGILQRARGQFLLAQNTYLQILKTNPNFFDAHFNLGILYDLYLRQPLKALNHYQAYLNNAPEADARVKKWLVDLNRRTQVDASASARMTSHANGVNENE